MPAPNPSPSPEDMYGDAPGGAPAESETTPEEQAAPESEETAESGSTALLPTNFFGGSVKPGDTCTVRVVRVHDNQVEVEYDKSEGSEAPAPEAAPAPEGDLASMME